MPRQPRLDAPGVPHHVIVRGLERRAIFRNDADRTDLVLRLAGLAEHGAFTVYGWALRPNHAPLLARTGTRPLAPPSSGSGPRMSTGRRRRVGAPPGDALNMATD